MASALAACRNAVVSRISGGSYVRTPTVKGVYSETNETATTSTTTCDVLVRIVANDGPDYAELAGSRGATFATIPVEIVVAGAVADKTSASIDPLLEVVEQIRDRLWAREAREISSSGKTFRFLRTELNPLTDPTSIQERHFAAFSMIAYYVHQQARPSGS